MGQFFPYAFENKRYHTWNYHLKNKFGQKSLKLQLTEDLIAQIEMAQLHMVAVRFVLQQEVGILQEIV